MHSQRSGKNIILITGGAGYIGSKLVHDLATDPRFNGHIIRIYDNLQRHHLYGLMNLPPEGHYEFVEGDILDRLNLQRAMHGAKAVIHLAAIVRTPLSFDHPEWTEQVNHWGTAAVVEAALAVGLPQLIYSSSAGVYGPGGPFKETDICRPIGPYAISKRKAEEEVLQGMQRGLNATIFRLGTVFGNAPAMRFDGVASRLTYLVGVRRPLIIHGSGDQIRPLIHVQDASAILQQCLLEEDWNGQIINAATMNVSANQIAEILRLLVPRTSLRYTDQDILTEVSFQIDSGKIFDLGFKPKFDLKAGLEEMLTCWRGFQAPLSDIAEKMDLLSEIV